MFESFLWFAIGCVSYGIVARLLSVAFVEEVQFKLVLLRSLLLLRVAKEKSESLLRVVKCQSTEEYLSVDFQTYLGLNSRF